MITQDITTVYLWRATWLTVGDIVRANTQIPPSHYFAYLSNTYGTSQALAVRRLADERRGVVSLATLVKDVGSHASEITAAWWAGLDPNLDARDFRPFQAVGTDHFDPAIGDRDLIQLRKAVSRVKKYVNQHLAHRDPNPTKDIPTFGEIHSAMDSVGEVFRKYYMLLTGADRLFMVPIPQPGWHRPFTVSWLPPGSAPPRLRGTAGSDSL
jgi:hypothetical protein